MPDQPRYSGGQHSSILLALASQGEEVLITVVGRAVARLTGLPKPVARPSKREWLDKLARLRVRTATGRPGPTVVEILAEARGDFPAPCGPAHRP